MVALKINTRWRRTVSLVMILAVIQAGLLGSVGPVLAQSGETIADVVYQSGILPPGVAEAVYVGEEQSTVVPSPLKFLQEKLLNQLSAPSGKIAVSGQVTENSTGMPLVGVTVQLLLDGHPTQFKTSTDSQGNYTLSKVGLGQYLLAFKHPGYAPEQFELNVSEADVQQDCGLFRNTSFKGRVVDELGVSLEGVKVTLADQNLSDRDIQLLTNVDGWFNLEDVPPGRYRLSVSQSVYHKQKVVWVDEYPQELTMVLPLSVAKAVYEEIPAKGVTVEEQPTDSPNVGDEQPTAGDEQPTAGDEQPLAGNEQPPVGDEQPPAGNEQPPAGNEQPPAGNEQPTVGDEQPIVGNEQPIVGNEQQSLNYFRFNITSFPFGRRREPLKPSQNWFPEFHALKEHDPLIELEQLLKQQATIA